MVPPEVKHICVWPASPLQHIYSKAQMTGAGIDSHAWIPWCTGHSSQKLERFKSPSTNEWTDKMYYTHEQKDAAIKRKGVDTCYRVGKTWNMMLNEPDAWGHVTDDSIYIDFFPNRYLRESKYRLVVSRNWQEGGSEAWWLKRHRILWKWLKPFGTWARYQCLSHANRLPAALPPYHCMTSSA